ncbi:nuA3 HAT complex component nto1 [Dinochytrium kinnereticum]|nr:nuA3 HAT complex component nto1 [Dinochytrium kinnereticum]
MMQVDQDAGPVDASPNSNGQKAVRSSSRKIVRKPFYPPNLYELDTTLFTVEERRKWIGRQAVPTTSTSVREHSLSPVRSPIRTTSATKAPKSLSRSSNSSSRRRSRPYSRKSSMASLAANADSPEPEEAAVVERPLEERPYQELFPDLDIHAPVRILRMHPNFGILPDPEPPSVAGTALDKPSSSPTPAFTPIENDRLPDAQPTTLNPASTNSPTLVSDELGMHDPIDTIPVPDLSSLSILQPSVPNGASSSSPPLKKAFNLSPEASESEMPSSKDPPVNHTDIVLDALPPSLQAVEIQNPSAPMLSPRSENGTTDCDVIVEIDGDSSLADGSAAMGVETEDDVSVEALNTGTTMPEKAIDEASQTALVQENSTTPDFIPDLIPHNSQVDNNSIPNATLNGLPEPSNSVTITISDENGDPSTSTPQNAPEWALDLFRDESPARDSVSKADIEAGGVEIQTEIPPLNVVFQKAVPKAVFSQLEVVESAPQEEWMPGFKKPGFIRPEGYYVRYVEPTEGELAERIEYDMDEQDMAWLKLVNEDRRAAGESGVPELVFELIMDRLEKEWFDLTKDLPKPVRDESSSEDTACAVCDDGECENSNAIVFCDGCNLAVHQDCYGVPYIPEGQWLCRKCMLSPETPVSCIFCPNEGGAFKQTNTSRWAHVMCAQWIPEAHFANPVYMEPIESVEAIPESRWKLIVAFVTLLKKEHRDRVDMEAEILAFRQSFDQSKAKAGDGGDASEEENPDALTSGKGGKRSSKKTPKRSYVRRIDDTDEEEGGPSDHGSRSARAHQLHYAPQTPVVPYSVAKKITAAIKSNLRKKSWFVEMVCRYWSLKRESRRGAPLLKRLHLEPWTATASATKEDETFRAMRNEILVYIRKDLERVRLLAELVKKREKEKLKQYQMQVQSLDLIFNPVTQVLRPILEDIKRLDHKILFGEPVNLEEVPDYLDVVKTPMDFFTMTRKLELNEYRNLATFERDLNLICDNAILYNAPETMWGRAARRLKIRMEPALEKARAVLKNLSLLDPECGYLSIRPSDRLFYYGYEEPPPVVEEIEEEEEVEVREPVDGETSGNKENVDEVSPTLPPEVLAPPGDEELAKELQEKEALPIRNRSLRSRPNEEGDGEKKSREKDSEAKKVQNGRKEGVKLPDSPSARSSRSRGTVAIGKKGAIDKGVSAEILAADGEKKDDDAISISTSRTLRSTRDKDVKPSTPVAKEQDIAKPSDSTDSTLPRPPKRDREGERARARERLLNPSKSTRPQSSRRRSANLKQDDLVVEKVAEEPIVVAPPTRDQVGGRSRSVPARGSVEETGRKRTRSQAFLESGDQEVEVESGRKRRGSTVAPIKLSVPTDILLDVTVSSKKRERTPAQNDALTDVEAVAVPGEEEVGRKRLRSAKSPEKSVTTPLKKTSSENPATVGRRPSLDGLKTPITMSSSRSRSRKPDLVIETPITKPQQKSATSRTKKLSSASRAAAVSTEVSSEGGGDLEEPSITDTATEEEFDIAQVLLNLTPNTRASRTKGDPKSLRKTGGGKSVKEPPTPTPPTDAKRSPQRKRVAIVTTHLTTTQDQDAAEDEMRKPDSTPVTPTTAGSAGTERRSSLRMTTFKILKPLKNTPRGFFDQYLEDSPAFLQVLKEVRLNVAFELPYLVLV